MYSHDLVYINSVCCEYLDSVPGIFVVIVLIPFQVYF